MRLSLCSLCLLTSLLGFSQKVTRTIAIEKGQTFLNLPVHSSKSASKMRIKLDNKTLDEFSISLTDGTPEFWAFFDVSPYQGKTLNLEADVPDAKSIGFDKVVAADRFPGQDSLYKEK
jgi:hypothetical protein